MYDKRMNGSRAACIKTVSKGKNFLGSNIRIKEQKFQSMMLRGHLEVVVFGMALKTLVKKSKLK